MLNIRCLGGLEARRGDEAIEGFESRKVRALLAYLACQRDRAFSREHLSALLWPEKDERLARRNLRQALYNLRTVLTLDGDDDGALFAPGSSIRLRTDDQIWVDVEAFDAGVQAGLPPARISPHELASAVRLYRGDLLTDLSLAESSAFEDWLDTERERLRESMAAALRTLVEGYIKRGEYRLGLQYAQRLVALDPLSEEAHRYLIRLFALSGRRRRALDQYQELEQLLDEELGVEPLEETQGLYQEVLADRTPLALAGDEGEPIGPLVPLVGRTRELGAMSREWQKMRRGQARVVVVEGERGIGKTRLVRSFLDAATSDIESTILMGRCVAGIPSCYQPLSNALQGVLDDAGIAESPPANIRRLVPLVPELAELRAPEVRRPTLGHDAIYSAVVELFELLVRPPGSEGGRARPLVLFLDDLQHATEETYDLVAYVLACLADQPIWIVATAPAEARIADSIAAAFTGQGAVPAPVVTVRLSRLDRGAIGEVAAWLTGGDDTRSIADLLEENSGGLPFHIAELINFLWDQGRLEPTDDGRWRLVPLTPDDPADLGDLETMLEQRLARLPFSTRRLAALAAVISVGFEPELIRRTADEHPSVVDVGLEIMLERWILRQNADRWSNSRRQRDIVMWSRGARQGRFDFSHWQTRQVIYDTVSPPRRRLIHLQVAEALEAIHEEDRAAVAELLAFHFDRAGDAKRAARYATLAAIKASSLGARPVSSYYRHMARVAGDSSQEVEAPAKRSGGVMRDSGMFAVP